MIIEISWLNSLVSLAILIAALKYLLPLWIGERLKTSLRKEHSKFLEDLKWELKAREQAVKVAEYLVLIRDLKNDSDYKKAMQLSWELAMWLPEEIYKEMGKAAVNETKQTNALTVVISVRKLLLQDKAGNLEPDNVIVHAPGIGKQISPTDIVSDD